MSLNTRLLTVLAMIAFAANSLLCRAALEQGAIDAASFTAIRVVSGTVVLLALLSVPPRRRWSGSVPMALMLFVYMIGFSFAYRSLGAATGALLLFGAVQLTMFAWALRSGERFGPRRTLGLLLAIAGLVYLLLPGASAPDPLGAALMGLAGLAWGAYSLLGRGSVDPMADTAGNFLLATPLALLVLALAFTTGTMPLHVTPAGVWLGILSGAVASGLGYVIWYAALRGLEAGQAATVQLSVPVIAAVGAVLLLGEPLGLHLVMAGVVTLGGVWLALARPGHVGRPASGGTP